MSSVAEPARLPFACELGYAAARSETLFDPAQVKPHYGRGGHDGDDLAFLFLNISGDRSAA